MMNTKTYTKDVVRIFNLISASKNIEHKLRSERVDFIDYWYAGKIEVKGNKLIIEYYFSTYTLDIEEHISSNSLVYDFVNPAKLPKEAREMLEKNNAITSLQKVYVSRLIKGLQGHNLKDKDVHHLNKNSQCNRSTNLMVLTRKEHLALHGGEISLSDLVLTLPDKPKKVYKPHTKRHISERKIFNIKKYLLFGKSANWIKKELRTDKKTIAEIKNKNLDQLELSTYLKQKLKRLKAKLLKTLSSFFSNLANKPKHALSNEFNCMYNSITCPNANNNADTS